MHAVKQFQAHGFKVLPTSITPKEAFIITNKIVICAIIIHNTKFQNTNLSKALDLFTSLFHVVDCFHLDYFARNH